MTSLSSLSPLYGHTPHPTQDLINLINTIPVGKVTSYGTLATILNTTKNHTLTGRSVWRLLSRMPRAQRDLCPWRRVINKQGYISSRKLWDKGQIQEQQLIAEWIIVHDGYVDMVAYGWNMEL